MCRFDDALAAVEGATKLDMNNREVKAVLRRAKAVAMARSQGNDLFKESRFTEACFAYSEGLQHDPYNSVLLCNRATSRSKLGQFDKALEDCNLALNLRPNYTKARLRRAQFNAKVTTHSSFSLLYLDICLHVHFIYELNTYISMYLCS